MRIMIGLLGVLLAAPATAEAPSRWFPLPGAAHAPTAASSVQAESERYLPLNAARTAGARLVSAVPARAPHSVPVAPLADGDDALQARLIHDIFAAE